MKLSKLESSFSSINEDEKNIIDTMAQLYAQRIKKNISQRDLAQRIGMTQPQLSKLETLESVPTLRTLNRYARGLDIKIQMNLVIA